MLRKSGGETRLFRRGYLYKALRLHQRKNPRRNRKNVEVDFRRAFPARGKALLATEERGARGAAKDERGPQQNVKTRKNLYRRIRALSEKNLQSLVHDLSELESGEVHELNEETVAAIKGSLDPEDRIECRDIQGMFKR